MIKFQKESFEKLFPNWAKHHKQVGVRVKRVYEDGEEVFKETNAAKESMEKHPDSIRQRTIYVYSQDENTFRRAVESYILLDNQEYKEADVPHYAIGASNTTQETKVRLTFQLENDRFIIDHSFKSGRHAPNLFQMYGEDDVEEILDDLCGKVSGGELAFEDAGIQSGKKDDYNIIVLRQGIFVDDYEVSKRDILDSLIGIEVYKFDMKIE